MDDYITRTVNAYDDVEKYESNTQFLTPTQEIDKLLDLIPKGAKILDAGCAYGRDSDYMQKKGYVVTGFDLSASLIKRAQELYPAIEFSQRDVRSTGFDENSFDGIWCNATLLHLNDEDMLRALLELRRIVKPKGFIAVSLKKGTGNQTFVETFSSNSERYFNFKTHETFLEMLGQAKLREVAWHYVNERERYGSDYRDLDWLYSYSQK